MTAITPLQSVHKKGLFGNHYKKEESDLLNITEVTDLTIVQIAQYKNSKINLNNLNIDGLKFPLQPSTVSSNQGTRILWSGPNTWLVVSKKKNIIKIIRENCSDENFAVTDISHSRVIIKIKGLKANEVLKKGCPINFNEFKQDKCAGSVFNGINIVVDCVDEKIQTFDILTLRSFGESLYHHITDSALEFGYNGI